MDITGNGIGVYDLITRQWATKIGKAPAPGEDYATVAINGYNYSYSPTKSKICEEDTKTPEDLFDRLATELYYATAKFFEMKVIKLGRAVDSEDRV